MCFLELLPSILIHISRRIFYRYDAELDPDSGIKLLMTDENQQKRITADPDTNAPFAALSRPNLCGNIHGIVYLTQGLDSLSENDERTKHNNFGVDTITLQCHENGKYIHSIFKVYLIHKIRHDVHT